MSDGHGAGGAHDAHDAHGHHGSRFIQHHYDDAQHQFDSGKLGIWLFLAQEVLFFSAHYALHSRRLFRSIHHIHHRFRQPIGISTHYVHFAEHLVRGGDIQMACR